MVRDCEYHRPSDGAQCVMGAWHLTNHYFAEAESAVPASSGAGRVAAPDGIEVQDEGLLSRSHDT